MELDVIDLDTDLLLLFVLLWVLLAPELRIRGKGIGMLSKGSIRNSGGPDTWDGSVVLFIKLRATQN